MSNPDEVKVTGLCDICQKKEAKYWYGNTAAATCGSVECGDKMDQRYAEHCEEMERQFELEKQMEEEYGSQY